MSETTKETKPAVKQPPKQRFFFPGTKPVSIEATSLEEATRLYQKSKETK